MSALPVIAIFDVGKTNKKLFLFDENYEIVFERLARFTEIADEDGFPCENIESLRLSVVDSLQEVVKRKEFLIKAINFSAYGASLVYIGNDGRPVAPLYNYLKPYPEELKKRFYETYGGEEKFSLITASPVLGSLNSGMQLYRIKYEKPELFNQIKYALHLPQYMSYLLTGEVCADITSIGCHTNLWDFEKNGYHEWVFKERISEKLPPIVPCDTVNRLPFQNNCLAGTGLHDSSAALIPYLVNFRQPFVLISTGTWCISLNPFYDVPLTAEELQHDCLCFLQYNGKRVKASRIFAGNEHEQQVKRIGDYFHQSAGRYRNMQYDNEVIVKIKQKEFQVKRTVVDKDVLKTSLFSGRDMHDFADDTEAYHQLIFDIVAQQYDSTQLLMIGTEVKRIFVDGGFSKNIIYMNLLASFFFNTEVFAASIAQATASGTALCIHNSWNQKPVANNIIELTYFSSLHHSVL